MVSPLESPFRAQRWCCTAASWAALLQCAAPAARAGPDGYAFAASCLRHCLAHSTGARPRFTATLPALPAAEGGLSSFASLPRSMVGRFGRASVVPLCHAGACDALALWCRSAMLVRATPWLCSEPGPHNCNVVQAIVDRRHPAAVVFRSSSHARYSRRRGPLGGPTAAKGRGATPRGGTAA